MWKELFVNANEALFGELTIRTVFLEAFVPLSNFFLSEVCVFLKLRDNICTELTVFLAHDDDMGMILILNVRFVNASCSIYEDNIW